MDEIQLCYFGTILWILLIWLCIQYVVVIISVIKREYKIIKTLIFDVIPFSWVIDLYKDIKNNL